MHEGTEGSVSKTDSKKRGMETMPRFCCYFIFYKVKLLFIRLGRDDRMIELVFG